MKKFIALVLAAMLCMLACSALAANLKVGVIVVGDETEGYTLSHMNGVKEAAANVGLADNQIIWKYKTPEDQSCYDAALDCIGQGCNLIISNSYGHQTYMVLAAEEYPDVTFVSMTGDFAALTGLDNFKNAFTKIYEARYVSGVVAGMKVAELLESGELSPEKQPNSFDENGNVKIGYVGAFDYAEVVSGFTSFFLGIRSVVPNVAMEVNYTNSWFDIDKEAAAAEALIAKGCVIIGQHADSTGAPAATQKLQDAGTLCYCVGYNIDMIPTAPTAALTSPTNVWSVFYTQLMNAMINGEAIAADWAEGYATDAVKLTALNTEICAPGTAEKVEEVIAGIKAGTVKPFDAASFTVGGQALTSSEVDMTIMDWATMTVAYEGAKYEAIVDGAFVESTFRSAPYFALRIDGITEIK